MANNPMERLKEKAVWLETEMDRAESKGSDCVTLDRDEVELFLSAILRVEQYIHLLHEKM